MSSLVKAAGAEAPERKGPRAPAMVRAAYWLLGCVLAGFLVSLIVRPAGAYSTWLDGWGVDGFEVIVCALAFGLRLRPRPAARVPLALRVRRC